MLLSIFHYLLQRPSIFLDGLFIIVKKFESATFDIIYSNYRGKQNEAIDLKCNNFLLVLL